MLRLARVFSNCVSVRFGQRFGYAVGFLRFAFRGSAFRGPISNGSCVSGPAFRICAFRVSRFRPL
eukprot:13299421-Alexandrium_andersonii.AAC.1